MHVMATHPSSRVTCPWHGLRSGLGCVHTLSSPLTYTHNKCSSQTEPGQPGEPGSISKLDPRHPGPTKKEGRGSAAGALASLSSPWSSGTRFGAYLFDSTLEASLLVLHPVHLSEGASAQAGLARGPVDLLSVLVIHRLQFLELAEKGPFQWPGHRGTKRYSQEGPQAGAEPSQPKTSPRWGLGGQDPEGGLWELGEGE